MISGIVAFILFGKGNNSFAQLAGGYTIGGASPSYSSFTTAVNALIAMGISGPVTFHVRPDIYTEQVSIPQVAGASSSNTITFQSETSDSTSVVLTYAGSASSTSNYTVQLNGADFITFSKMTLGRSGTFDYTSVIDIRNNATNNSFLNNVIRNDSISSVSSGNTLVSNSSSSNDSMNSFIYNRFENGSFGLYYFGASSAYENGTIVTDNAFNNQTVYSIQTFYQKNLTVSRNQFTSNAIGFATALYVSNCSGNSFVTQNKINLLTGGSGIYFLQCQGSVSEYMTCANNFVYVEGGSQAYGIRGNSCSFLGIYFNSVNITSTVTTNNIGLEMTSAGSIQNKVKNNILVNAVRFCVSVNNSAVAEMNYNDLVGPSVNFASYNGTVQASFSAWRTASGFDSNSVSVNPIFTSVSDLHIGNFALNNIGVPAGNITVDIDNQSRNVTTPDIGADEINPANSDAGVTRIIAPSDGACGNTNTVVAAIVKNFAAVPQTNITATIQVTGTINTTLSGTLAGPLPVFASDTIFFSPSLNTSAGELLKFVCYTTLAGDQDHTNDTLVVDSVDVQAIPPPPSLTASAPSCPGVSTTVNATFSPSNQVYWFASPSGGNYIHRGNPLTVTPHGPTTYYAEVRDTAGSGIGCLRITECELNDVGGHGDYIEIQNCSASSIDATGWVVAASNSYTVINSVNTMLWNLGVFAPGEIQVRSDLSSAGSDYWGNNLLWNGGTTSRGWAMIVDNNGSLVDFAIWNWTAADIQTISVTVNGFLITPVNGYNGSAGVACTGGSVSRIGSSDNDDSTDFTCQTQTYDVQNPNLLSPFSDCGGGGCPSDRVPVVVTVLPPIIDLGNDTIITPPNTIILNAGSGFTSYLWSTNATSTSITISAPGTYWVTVSDANGCQNSDTIRVDLPTGLDETDLEQFISIYPNPADDFLGIDFHFMNEQGKISISLSDELGRKLFTDETEAGIQHGRLIIPMVPFGNGIYFLEFRSEHSILTKKIIKL